MKTYEVRMGWNDKQAKRMGVTYPGRHLVRATVEARTPEEAANKAQAINPGYVKQSLRTV